MLFKGAFSILKGEGNMNTTNQRVFLHNMYFYKRSFNFEVYTLLQAMINCNVNVLVNGVKGAAVNDLLKSLFDAKNQSGFTLTIGTDLKHLYPKRNIKHMERDDQINEVDVSGVNTMLVNGVDHTNLRLFLKMCKDSQGIGSLEGKTLNYALDELVDLMDDKTSLEEIAAIDFVLTIESSKLVSMSEVILEEGELKLRPFAEYIGGNEYRFTNNVSAQKLIQMKETNYEEAERFTQSLSTYQNELPEHISSRNPYFQAQ